MSRPDLRALFRSNDRSLRAVDVFANRENEWAAGVRSLANLIKANRSSTFDVEDMEAPRRNVLAFYGVGGIGKTTLSQQILERLSGEGRGPQHWPPIESALGRVVAARVDLSIQANADLESILLALRVAVAELGQPMPAFDLAFHRYWEHNHPGESLADYLRRNSFFSRISSAMSVPDQIQEVITDVAQALLLPGSVGSLVGQTLKLVVSGLRDRNRRAKILASCTRLPDLLEADPDTEALSYYAHLLAWDLAQLPEDRSATLVVLLDTFEDVGDRTHRDVERLIQRMMWLMPNVLFVVTGRNRLQWDDERLEGQLDWAGSRAWPLLASNAGDDPRQHRVGYLSVEDSELYLARRLRRDEQPLMTKAVRDAVISRSQGLPLYLDLSVMRFLDLHDDEHSPKPEDFDHDFPALVARTFRDLTLAERQVIRAVSLLDAFSIELATATTGGIAPESATRALLERPFIEYDPSRRWPYSLHSLVRSAIQDADSTAEDRWSPAEWQRAAGRALAALGDEFGEAERVGDRGAAVACLRQGFRLARDFQADLGWLIDAAYWYVEESVWEPIDVPSATIAVEPSTVSSDRSRAAQALASVLDAVARRQREHRRLTIETLEEIIAADALPDGLLELPLYYAAKSHRDIGNLGQALEGMREVASREGRLAPDASRGLLSLARRLGRFREALRGAEALGRRGHRDRALGNIWWAQGEIARACSSYTVERDAALGDGHPEEAALSQAALAFAAAFHDRGRALEQVERAQALLAGSNRRSSHGHLVNAELLCDAGFDALLPERIAEAVARASEPGLTVIAAYARFVLCFHAAVLDDAVLLATARDELRLSVHGGEFAYLLEASYFLAAETVPTAVPRADWIDGAETTGARWRRLVVDRRRDAASTRD